MDLPIQDECIVSGNLGVTLRMSRIFGLAPLKIKGVRRGWLTRISFAANLYSMAVLCLSFLMSLAYMVYDYNMERQLSNHFKTGSDAVAAILVMSAILLLLLVATCTGFDRMKSMITCLSHMQKVNADLCLYGPPSSVKFKSMIFIPICSYIASWINYILLYSIILYYSILEDKYDFLRQGLHAMVDLAVTMNKLLILQVTLILATVPASLHHLNCCLKILLEQIRNQSLNLKVAAVTWPNIQLNSYNSVCSNKSINSYIYSLGQNTDAIDKPFAIMATTVKRLRTLFSALCFTMKQTNVSHGLLLAVVITHFIILLVITLYNLIIWNLHENDNINYVFILSNISWLIMQITDLVMIIEPCHRAYEQMESTKRLIGWMLLFTPAKHHKIIRELELFYKSLMNDVIYTPMGIFYLNRTVIVTVHGNITTYLVIMVKL